MQNTNRKIIHVDMDAFFAAVEQRDNPQLRGKPIVVGGSGKRGVIAAASYEARKYGVRSAMPSVVAQRKCPHLIFVSHRFDAYIKVSQQIREIFLEYTDLVEPLSLDEAFLDVTSTKSKLVTATEIAKEIKIKIKEKTNLVASAGVSYNKFLAKVASDYNKPDGFFLIHPKNAIEFVEKLKIEDFFGIGKVTAEKMHKMNIYTGLDLKQFSLPEMIRRFGKSGSYYYKIARAEDTREVNPNRIRKSLGSERTFIDDVSTEKDINKKIEEIAITTFERCKKANAYGYTLTLKVKFSDFKQITRSKTSNTKFDTESKMLTTALLLSKEVDFNYDSVRLIGVSATSLHLSSTERHMQLTFGF